MGIIPGGGYAEYVTVPATLCIPVPDSLSLHRTAEHHQARSKRSEELLNKIKQKRKSREFIIQRADG